MTFVALLRGVNVGKASRVAMDDLRRLVEALGFADVSTVLNSGNVVFRGEPSAPEDVAPPLEAALAEQLRVPARVVVLTGPELAAIVTANPLTAVAPDASRLLVGFLAAPADRALLEPLLATDWSPEVLALGERVAYLWCPAGMAGSPLAQGVGRAAGDGVTMRNWATVTKLAALARG